MLSHMLRDLARLVSGIFSERHKECVLTALILLAGLTVGSSPISLLAWRELLFLQSPAVSAHSSDCEYLTVAEKYRDWTDETPSIDEILAICTMWWLRDSFPSSIYAYHGTLLSRASPPSDVDSYFYCQNSS